MEILTLAMLVRAAANDAALLPPELRIQARYLTVADEEEFLVLSGHVQHLSRESDIQRPRFVAGSKGRLVRIFLADYRWPQEAWEKLADADPYYHVRLETEEVEFQEWGYHQGGKWIKTKLVPTGKKIRRTTAALAPWLAYSAEGKKNLSALVGHTQTQAPILRADWFMNQTMAQFGRQPGYYDFLEVKNEADFKKLIGFDEKLAKEFGKELREAVSESGVTTEPRAFSRHNTVGGGYWRSLDFIKATDKKNPLRVLGGDIEEAYDASEQFGHLANGMWATGIFARDGKRADFAPAEVASDNASRSNDKKVHVNISCLRCHGPGGLHPMDAFFRGLLQPPIGLTSPDPARARELRQQYVRKLEPFLKRDAEIFEDAVKEATGLGSKEYLTKYARAWEAYEDAKVDIAYAARDLGIEAAAMKIVLEERLKRGILDTVASSFISKKPKRLGIRQWEELYPVMKSYLAEKEANDEKISLALPVPRDDDRGVVFNGGGGDWMPHEGGVARAGRNAGAGGNIRSSPRPGLQRHLPVR